MRLDVWLKHSRLIKGRVYAKLACDRGYVSLNGRKASAAKGVRPGDVLLLELPNRRVDVEVVDVPEVKSVSAKDASSLYRLISFRKAHRDGTSR